MVELSEREREVVLILTEMRAWAVSGPPTRSDDWYLERIDRCLDQFGVRDHIAQMVGAGLEGMWGPPLVGRDA